MQCLSFTGKGLSANQTHLHDLIKQVGTLPRLQLIKLVGKLPQPQVSHTTCTAICDHPRNLTDEQIRALADNGGVMGMTFVPHFVAETAPTFNRFIDQLFDR